MKQLTIKENEANQRLDKFLSKYMDKAPKSFFYKMLRKKNITLNKRKADGSERLQTGDEIQLFLSDETIKGFSGSRGLETRQTGFPMPQIVYEDDHVLLLNKPAGLLSQKAKPTDVSLVEVATAYLLESGQLSQADLRTFHPGICSRLDRNTSGLLAAGKSLAGLQEMNALIQTHQLKKYYRCIVLGAVKEGQRMEGWLKKNERTNQVRIFSQEQPDSQYICTEYVPLKAGILNGRACTYLEVHLITGRSHQIRAHLASIGHPLLGDGKYGDPKMNQYAREAFGLTYQLLHAFRLEFPKVEGALAGVSEGTFMAELPDVFKRVCEFAFSP